MWPRINLPSSHDMEFSMPIRLLAAVGRGSLGRRCVLSLSLPPFFPTWCFISATATFQRKG